MGIPPPTRQINKARRVWRIMSDASSEISDDALDKLVSRLVEVAEEDASMQVLACTNVIN